MLILKNVIKLKKNKIQTNHEKKLNFKMNVKLFYNSQLDRVRI